MSSDLRGQRRGLPGTGFGATGDQTPPLKGGTGPGRTPRIDVSPPAPLHRSVTAPDRRSTGHTEASPATLGPWACNNPANGWDWDQTNRCKAICARCTTRVECAARWLSLPRAQRKYGSGVWAGFDMDDPLERVHLGRWHGKQVRR